MTKGSRPVGLYRFATIVTGFARDPGRVTALMLAVLVTAAGCARYPLGMSETEWRALNPQQQMEARTKQAELDRARAAQEAAERARREREKAAERERIAGLYATAGYGEIVECALEGGLVDFHPGWKSYLPFSFALVRGETREIKITSTAQSDTQKVWASFSDQLTGVSLCYQEPAPDTVNDCASVAGLTEDFVDGVEQRISTKELFNGVRLRCIYRPITGGDTEPERREPRRAASTVECVISGGRAIFGAVPKPYHDLIFSLGSGEGQYLRTISRADGDTNRFWVDLDPEGRKVTVCGQRPFGANVVGCGVIAGLSGDFLRGIEKQLDVAGTLEGAAIRCGYPAHRTGGRSHRR